MTINICVSVLPSSVDDGYTLCEKAMEYSPRFIEVRLDQISKYETFSGLTSFKKVPLIATNKSSLLNHEEKYVMLLNAVNSGFQYVDVDFFIPNLKSKINKLKKLGADCIVSFHDFHNSLNLKELLNVFEKQLSLGADVCKIVTTPTSISDNLTLLNFISDYSEKRKIVCFGMGTAGKISRVLSPLFGAFFTFASLDKMNATAPGQMSIKEMITIYNLLGIM